MSLVEVLKEFQGIGPAGADILAKRLRALGLAKGKTFTYKDVRKMLKNTQIYANLPDATKVEVDEQPIRRIPRALIKIMDKELSDIWRTASAIPKYVIAGSYIRGRPTSGDIDFVLCKLPGKSPEATWDYFSEYVNHKSHILRIHPPFARGPSKVDTLFEITVPPALRAAPEIKEWLSKSNTVKFWVNTFLTTSKEFIFALLYAIGSGQFNLRMRALAKKKGYLLNQRGLFKRTPNGLEEVPIKKEEDIFNILGMHYRPPEERLT